MATRISRSMKQRAIDVAAFLRGSCNFVLRDEDEIVRAGPALEGILEGFADDALPLRSGNLPLFGELVQARLDEQLTQASLTP